MQHGLGRGAAAASALSRARLANLPPARPQANDNVFVNTVAVDSREKVYAVTDSPAWQELDLASLNITGAHAWAPGLSYFSYGMLGSAHPLPLPGGGGTVVDFQTEMGPAGTTMRVYSVDTADATKRSTLAKFKPGDALPKNEAWTPYVHSFGLLPEAAVFPLSPIHVDVKPMVETGLMESAFGTVPSLENASLFVLAPFDGSDVNETKMFRVDRPNYFLHTLNAFWNGTTVVVDCTVASEDPFKGPNVRLDVMRNKTLRDRVVNTDANMRVDRFRLFEDGTVAQETLSAPGRSTDFTKINFEYAAQDYCYYYGIEWGHDLESYGSMAVVKQDLCAGVATHWHRPGWFPGEASFVPTGGTNEDDGVLVFVALHGANRTSSFVVADATTMDTVFEYELPAFVPFPTHGQFFAF